MTQKIKMKAVIAFVMLCLVLPAAFAQTKTPNPWETKLQTAKTDTARLRICIDAGNWYRIKVGNGDSTNFFLEKGLHINNKIGTNKQTPKLFSVLGNLANDKADLDKAEFYYKQSQQAALQVHDPITYQKATYNLITITAQRGYITSAIKQLLAFDPIVANKTHQDSIVKRVVYSRLSKYYRDLDDLQKCHFYLQKKLAYSKTLTDSLDFYQDRFTLGVLTVSLDMDAYSNVIRLSEKLNMPGGKIQLAINFSDYYIRKKQYDKAIEIGQSVLKMAGNNPAFESFKMYAYENIGEGYEGKKQYAEALQYFLKIPTDNPKRAIFLKVIYYPRLVKVYAALGDYKKAYEYSNMIAAYEEEVKGNRNKQIVAEIDAEMAAADAQKAMLEKQTLLTQSELKAKIQQEQLQTKEQERIAFKLISELEISKKEKEINLKQNEIATQKAINKLKEERIKKEQQQKTIVMALLLLSLGLLAWAVWSYRKQKQLKQLLEQQNLSLATKTEELTEANQTKDKIFAVLGHDLRSPINELKTILMLFHSRDITPMKMQELIQSLSLKIEVVHEMMNNLLQWSLLELKHQSNFTPQIIFINKVIEKVVAQLRGTADNKQLHIETSLPAAQILAQEEDLDIVIRNLLSNAIKFTPKGGTIRIEVVESLDFIEILCTDTGIGIPANTLETTTNAFPIQRKGTAGEVGSGLGLKITKELITKNQGKLLVHSENNQGTAVSIYFSKAINIKDEKLMP